MINNNGDVFRHILGCKRGICNFLEIFLEKKFIFNKYYFILFYIYVYIFFFSFHIKVDKFDIFSPVSNTRSKYYEF